MMASAAMWKRSSYRCRASLNDSSMVSLQRLESLTDTAAATSK
jgi:hypothetical protein